MSTKKPIGGPKKTLEEKRTELKKVKRAQMSQILATTPTRTSKRPKIDQYQNEGKNYRKLQAQRVLNNLQYGEFKVKPKTFNEMVTELIKPLLPGCPAADKGKNVARNSYIGGYKTACTNIALGILCHYLNVHEMDFSNKRNENGTKPNDETRTHLLRFVDRHPITKQRIIGALYQIRTDPTFKSSVVNAFKHSILKQYDKISGSVEPIVQLMDIIETNQNVDINLWKKFNPNVKGRLTSELVQHEMMKKETYTRPSTKKSYTYKKKVQPTA